MRFLDEEGLQLLWSNIIAEIDSRFSLLDQENIVQEVISAIGTPVFGRVDENNNIILEGNLAEGSYVFKFEDSNNNLINIGTVNFGKTSDIDLNLQFGIIDKTTGTISQNGTTVEYLYSNEIELLDDYNYIASLAAGSNTTFNVCYWDENKNYLSDVYYESGIGQMTVDCEIMIPKPSNAKYFRIRLSNYDKDWNGMNETDLAQRPLYLEYINTMVTVIKKPSSEQTNVIPLSLDSSNNLYNNGQGWKSNTRLSSSGPETAYDGLEVTGFIPVKFGNTLFFKNVEWIFGDPIGDKLYINAYDSNFALLGYFRADSSDEIPAIALDENNNIISVSLFNGSGFNKRIDNISYLRIGATHIGNNSIITINAPITNTTGNTSYTNLLPTAKDSDLTTIYNNTGYMYGRRINSSGVEAENSEAWWLTGYIPVSPGDVVRINNYAAVPGSGYKTLNLYTTTDTRVKDYGINELLALGTFTGEYSGSSCTPGALTFTIPTTVECSYMRLMIGNQSSPLGCIITVNEEIN